MESENKYTKPLINNCLLNAVKVSTTPNKPEVSQAKLGTTADGVRGLQWHPLDLFPVYQCLFFFFIIFECCISKLCFCCGCYAGIGAHLCQAPPPWSNWRARISSCSSHQTRGRSTTHAGARVSFSGSSSATCTYKATLVSFAKEETDCICDCDAGASPSRATCTSGATLDCTYDHAMQGFLLVAGREESQGAPGCHRVIHFHSALECDTEHPQNCAQSLHPGNVGLHSGFVEFLIPRGPGSASGGAWNHSLPSCALSSER
ncbi:uncharacterized protein LOC111814330 [Octodon degus]|uniref:Uncharacterized protein LOC111814330 n=1 Tax=Octodon degus TaxID=10160 RepID=A0A6P6DTD2_OCTDE|nr:uncharacterized protein LOC111814330 [Octodon degus]